MKISILMFILLLSFKSMAMITSVSKITCSKFTDEVASEVLEIVLGDANGENPVYKQTYFFKPLITPLNCKSKGAPIPDSITCQTTNELDIPVKINISSADGILNVADMTLEGQSSYLFCHSQLHN